MGLYMDLHMLEPGGVTPKELADAHQADLEIQGRYDVTYLTYWFNEPTGQAFCLVDAPSAEVAASVHRDSHGLVADQIIEVEAAQVGNFFGTGIALPTEPAPERDRGTRTILLTALEDSASMIERLGDEGAMELLKTHNKIIREVLQGHSGSEVKRTGDGIMASFISAPDGVECAISIQRAVAVHNREASESRLARFVEGGTQSLRPQDRAGEAVNHLRVRIGVNAGEPVTNDGELFGAAVQLAAGICERANADQILVGGVIRELCVGKSFEFKESGKLKGFTLPVQLFEVPWE